MKWPKRMHPHPMKLALGDQLVVEGVVLRVTGCGPFYSDGAADFCGIGENDETVFIRWEPDTRRWSLR